MEVPVIAIDGPSGSGKGTVARQVARQLGWHLLDSGALYRLVALAGAGRGLAQDDESGHAAVAATLAAEFQADPAGSIVNLRGITKFEVDVTLEIKDNPKPAFNGILVFLYHFTN